MKTNPLHLIRKAIEVFPLELEKLRRWRTWVPAGHFYSPIPSVEEVRKREEAIFGRHDKLAGIDLREGEQIETLKQFAAFYPDIPFGRDWQNNCRYFFANSFFSYADAIVLYAMIRMLRPRRIIEVGSGFSSAVMLDTNDKFFDGSIHCIFIEPYPDRLIKLAGRNIDLQVSALQDMPIALFRELSANDILFIDSSHVSKTGSDVNRLFFDILPSLNPRVYIHFHDIFFPFEYPKGWVYQGVAWNEAYLLRAFLQYNASYEIVFFTSFMLQRHREKMLEFLPLALESEVEKPTIADTPGGSFWLRKLR